MSSGRHQQRHMVVRDWRRQGTTLCLGRYACACARVLLAAAAALNWLPLALGKQALDCSGPHPAAATPLSLHRCRCRNLHAGLSKVTKSGRKTPPRYISVLCLLLTTLKFEMTGWVDAKPTKWERNSPDFGGAAFSFSVFAVSIYAYWLIGLENRKRSRLTTACTTLGPLEFLLLPAHYAKRAV